MLLVTTVKIQHIYSNATCYSHSNLKSQNPLSIFQDKPPLILYQTLHITQKFHWTQGANEFRFYCNCNCLLLWYLLCMNLYPPDYLVHNIHYHLGAPHGHLCAVKINICYSNATINKTKYYTRYHSNSYPLCTLLGYMNFWNLKNMLKPFPYPSFFSISMIQSQLTFIILVTCKDKPLQ